jgi:hypothetical protein
MTVAVQEPSALGLERMLRVYFLQRWYGLADEARRFEECGGNFRPKLITGKLPVGVNLRNRLYSAFP